MNTIKVTRSLADTLKFGNIPEHVYGIPAIPVDPFQVTYPCWTRIPLSTVELIKFWENRLHV